MGSRYNFEFFRHHCGQTLSIYDTEPCICEQPGYINPDFLRKETTMEKATATMRSLRRLLRRSLAHGHRPLYVKQEGGIAIVMFAGRHIRIRNDGTYVQDMMARYVGDIRKADPHCHEAFCRRFDFGELNWAGDCRRRGWRKEARRALESIADIRRSAA